jgi:hypothetical protein
MLDYIHLTFSNMNFANKLNSNTKIDINLMIFFEKTLLKLLMFMLWFNNVIDNLVNGILTL